MSTVIGWLNTDTHLCKISSSLEQQWPCCDKIRHWKRCHWSTERKLDSHDTNLVLFCALWLFICQKWWQPCTSKRSVQSKEHRNIVCLLYAEDETKREQKIWPRHWTPLRSSVGNPSYFTCDTAGSAAPSSCFPSGPSVTGTAGLATTLFHSKDQIKNLF